MHLYVFCLQYIKIQYGIINQLLTHSNVYNTLIFPLAAGIFCNFTILPNK